jgi:predicted transcriptional regulator
VLQQVVDVGQASREQLLVLASAIMQQPIGIHKDFCQTLTDMRAAVIHKCVYHLQQLKNKKIP